MTLIKTSVLSGGSVLVKMLSGLILNKIIAVYVGPSGFAVIGQFRSVISMVMTFASGALQIGVTKYTAEYENDEQRLSYLWSTAVKISLFGSLVIAAALIVFRELLAVYFLQDPKYSGVFLWLAASVFLAALNSIFLALLNGKREITSFVICNIAGSLLSLVVVGILVVQWKLHGALIALAVSQAVVFFATLFVCLRKPWFHLSSLTKEWHQPSFINLSKFMAIAAVTAIMTPFSHILIRSHLGEEFGWESAGYWEGLFRISDMYLLLITSTLSLYFLPKFAGITNAMELRTEIINGYKIILPVVALGAGSIYLLRDWIIALLFSDVFSPMADLFLWQMIGDVFKIGAWVVSYALLAKAMTKIMILAEVVFGLSFVGLVIILTPIFELQGVTIAFSINYLCYWIVMGHFTVRMMRRMGSSPWKHAFVRKGNV